MAPFHLWDLPYTMRLLSDDIHVLLDSKASLLMRYSFQRLLVLGSARSVLDFTGSSFGLTLPPRLVIVPAFPYLGVSSLTSLPTSHAGPLSSSANKSGCVLVSKIFSPLRRIWRDMMGGGWTETGNALLGNPSLSLRCRWRLP